jgi:hypothetical protein
MLKQTLRLLSVLTLLVTASRSVHAQQILTRGGGRGMYTFELSDGEPVSYFLEHSRELELTDNQRQSLIDVRRRLRMQNGPYMHQLDSLRNLLGISLEPRARISAEDRDALQRFQLQSQPVVDSIRANNQAAQQESRMLLDDRQRVMLDSLAKTDQGFGRGRGGRRPPA